MAGASQATMNWNEIDQTILSAIDAMQTARARLKIDPGWIVSRVAVSEAVAGQPQLHGRLISNYFADAEQLLQISRVQLMIARSISAGVTCMPSRDIQMLGVDDRKSSANASGIGLIGRISGRFQRARSQQRMRLQRIMHGVRRLGKSLNVACRHTIFGTKVLRRNFKRLLCAAVGQERSTGIARPLVNAQTHSGRNNATKSNSGRGIAWLPFNARPSRAMVAALCLAGGLTAWTAAASRESVLTVQASSVVNAPAPAEAVLSERTAPPARSCSVQAWGKACYAQRSRL